MEERGDRLVLVGPVLQRDPRHLERVETYGAPLDFLTCPAWYRTAATRASWKREVSTGDASGPRGAGRPRPGGPGG